MDFLCIQFLCSTCFASVVELQRINFFRYLNKKMGKWCLIWIRSVLTFIVLWLSWSVEPSCNSCSHSELLHFVSFGLFCCYLVSDWPDAWAREKELECVITGSLKGKHLQETAKPTRTSACLGISCTVQNLRLRIFLLNSGFSLNAWEMLISAFQSMKLDCRRGGVTAWMCSFLDIICCKFFAVKQNSCSWSSPKIPWESLPATFLQEWRATKCVEAWAVAQRVGSGEWGWEPSLSTLV